MFRSAIALSVAALTTATAVSAQEFPQKSHPELWFADFDVAAAKAKETGKDLLVDFTGSDWCGWCHRLDGEVFSHDEFVDGVKDHFVLVALDYPRSEEAKAKVPNPERNGELQSKYAVQGFPTVLAMTADGIVFGRTGYAQGGPKPYLANLDEMRETGKKQVLELMARKAEFDAATGDDRVEMVKGAVERLASMTADEIGIELVVEMARPALEMDNAELREACVRNMLAANQLDDTLVAAVAKIDPKNDKGLHDLVVQASMGRVSDKPSCLAFLDRLDKLLAVGVKKPEDMLQVLFNATRWAAGPVDDKARAAKYAEKLQPYVTTMEDGERKKQYQQIIDVVLSKG